MTTVSSGNDVNAILLERYPDLFFLLYYGCEQEAWVEFEAPAERCRGLDTLNLEALSTLYIYGIGDGSDYSALQPWLQQSPERRVIVLEDQIQALQRFLHAPVAPLFFFDPQVVLRYIPDPSQIDLVIQQLMIDYPCDRVEVIAQSHYEGEWFNHLRLELLRKSTLSHAVVTESLQYHKLLENILSNIRAWPGSFLASGLKNKFKNIPAVICGAGPSLEAHFPLLKTLEDNMLILAGGSAITALSRNGITPHLGIAFDPNKEEFERLKWAPAYEMPLIYGTRLEAHVLNALNGERGYLVSGTGGSCESHFEQVLQIPLEESCSELGMEALSVTTLNVSLAVYMGCNPILLSGVDLSYTGMQRYASGVLDSSSVTSAQIEQEVRSGEKYLERQDIHGRPVATLVKWIMESDCIASFAQKHPRVSFINVSESGLGFKGIPNRSFAEVVEKETLVPLDLRALVHAQIQQLKLPLLQNLIEEEMQKMKCSLERLSQIASSYIHELEQLKTQGLLKHLPTARLMVLALDFEEEPAFSCLHPLIGPVQDRLLNRLYTSQLTSSEEESRALWLKKQMTKFSQWKELIEKQLSVFKSFPIHTHF